MPTYIHYPYFSFHSRPIASPQSHIVHFPVGIAAMTTTTNKTAPPTHPHHFVFDSAEINFTLRQENLIPWEYFMDGKTNILTTSAYTPRQLTPTFSPYAIIVIPLRYHHPHVRNISSITQV